MNIHNHTTNFRRRLISGLLLLFLALSCRSTNTDPTKTLPGVSLRIWGTRTYVTDGSSDSFEVLVGAGYPAPELVTNVDQRSVRIEAIASQPDRGLGELRLTVNTLKVEESFSQMLAVGKVAFRLPEKQPTPLKQIIEHPIPLSPVGVLMLSDYNIYDAYFSRFQCPAQYRLEATVTVQATARNIAGKVSETPVVQLRFSNH